MNYLKIVIYDNIFFRDYIFDVICCVKNNYMRYYNTYENIDNYKTGFYVSFYVGDKLYEKTVLKNLSKKRKLDNNEFYGMKSFVFTREFFDYNLLGLALKGTAVCEIEPSTGVVINYFDLGMIIFNKKFISTYNI